MIYNEYAQVLEADNPDTGELYQPSDLNVIDYNEVGTAMLQDALFARAAWLAEDGNEDIAIKFLRATFKGWIYCRENAADCVNHGPRRRQHPRAGHQTWQLNEINALIWPSPDGIGQLDSALWDQTVQIALDSGIIAADPGSDAFRTDLAKSALEGISDDAKATDFTKGTVEVTPGGE